jgi:hypothetical protein
MIPRVIKSLPCLLADFKPHFKYFVLSYLDELMGLPHIDGKLEIFNFYPNYISSKIPHATSNIAQTIHKDLVWQIYNFLTQTS